MPIGQPRASAELRELEGDEFDLRFMGAMIVHHEGAIDQMRTWVEEWGLC